MCYKGERPISSLQSSQEAEAVVYNYFSSDPGWTLEKQEQGTFLLEAFHLPVQACSSWDKEAGQRLRRCRSLCGTYLKVTSAGRWLCPPEAIQQTSEDTGHDTILPVLLSPASKAHMVQLQSAVPAPISTWRQNLAASIPPLGSHWACSHAFVLL